MKTLCELISSLKQSEIRALKAQYSFRERSEQDKRGKLLDLILEKKVVTDEAASKYIYNSKPCSSFSHLKNRLYEDVCNMLALQPGINESELIPARAEVSQLIHVARVLKARDLYSQSLELVRDALDISLKNALVPELLLLKDLISSSFPEFWQKERSRVLSILSESVKTEADRLRAMNIAELVAQGDDDVRHVAELETIYRNSSCEQIKSIVHRSMINIHIRSNNKDKLIDECIQLYSLALATGPDPVRKQRNALAFSEITKAAVHVGSYDSAVIFGRAGAEFTAGDILCEFEINQNLLIAYLNLRDLNEAEKIIASMEKTFVKTNQLDFRRGYFVYLKAWYSYLAGDYKAALKTIAQCPPLTKEKEEWHAGFYVVELLSLLKLKMLFQIDYRNDAFRKFQLRHEYKDVACLETVYRSFKTFIDSDYERGPVKDLLEQINSTTTCIFEPSALAVVDFFEILREAFSTAD